MLWPTSARPVPLITGLMWANGVLAVVIIAVATADIGALIKVPKGDAASAPAVGGGTAAEVPPVPAAAALAETLERPLFRPDRRPALIAPPVAPAPQPTVAMVTPSPPPPADVRLVGFIGQGGERPRALLRTRNHAVGVSFGEGDVVEGWRIAHIDATTVVLELRGARHVLGMTAPARNSPGGRPSTVDAR